MATPGKPLDQRTREQIVRLRAVGLSVREVAKEQRVSVPTVQKVLKSA